MLRTKYKVILKYIFVPIVFLIFWFINIFILASPINATSTSSEQFLNTHIKSKIILQKNKALVGIFNSTNDNLGIISLHFINTHAVPYEMEDIIKISLKDVQTNTIVYSNTYRGNLLQSTEYFPIGFPKIVHSKNKQYELSLLSENGNKQNALTIDTRLPIRIHHIYTKEELLSTNLFAFFNEKLSYIYLNKDLLFISFFYLLPLLVYLLILSRKNKKKSKLFIYEFLLLLFTLSYVLLIQQIYFTVDFVLFGVWVTLFIMNKRDSKYSFIISFIMILICFISQAFNNNSINEKSSIWSFYFLLLGSIFLVKEVRKTV